jgi:hypothetical protein
MADRRAFLKSIAAAVAVGGARPSFHRSQAQAAASGIRKSTLISMLPRWLVGAERPRSRASPPTPSSADHDQGRGGEKPATRRRRRGFAFTPS